MTPRPTALIAEDEPLLAAALQAELALAWPELQVVAVVGDGLSAVAQALALQPDVLFFDIQMPGLNGLEAATELADAWPAPAPSPSPGTNHADQKAFPALVFVTAYDQYAVQAFEAQAMDYLLKPVQAARLEKTVSKLKLALLNLAWPAIDFESTLGQLRSLLAAASRPVPAPERLKTLAVSVGQNTRLLSIADIAYFEASDKYVRVRSGPHDYLIRTPLKDLLPQLDPQIFWQIHRGTVVNTTFIDQTWRNEHSRLSLSLQGLPEKLAVSRLYAYRFKAM
jgi:DNA-binding LytR/AlgR family response regulator